METTNDTYQAQSHEEVANQRQRTMSANYSLRVNTENVQRQQFQQGPTSARGRLNHRTSPNSIMTTSQSMPQFHGVRSRQNSFHRSPISVSNLHEKEILLQRAHTAEGRLDLKVEALPPVAGILMSEEVDDCCTTGCCHNADMCCRQATTYPTVMLCIVNVFLFADQNLMAPNLTQIGNEFHFNPIERDRKLGGDIALAFFMVGGMASLLVGYLADIVNRKVLFTVVVIIGEGACLATFWVTEYWHLIVLRAATGISIGGAMPLLFSMLGDMYTTHSRGAVSAIAGIAMGVGVGVGQTVAGVLGPTLGWRLPFIIVAVPALVLVIIFALTTSEPARGGAEQAILDYHQEQLNNEEEVELTPMNIEHDQHSDETGTAVNPKEKNSLEQNSKEQNNQEQNSKKQNNQEQNNEVDPVPASNIDVDDEEGEDGFIIDADGDDVGKRVLYEERMNCNKMGTLWRTPSVVLIFLQGIPGSLPWGVMIAYFNDFLAQEKHIPVEQSTMVIISFGVGAALGQILGGLLGDKLYRIDKRWVPAMMGTSTLLGMIPILIFINSPPQTIYVYCLICIPAGLLVSMTGSCLRALLLNVTLPETRGTAFAFFNLMDDLGKGLGPFVVSIIIEATRSRTDGLTYACVAWVLNAFLLFAIALVIDKDVLHMEEQLIRNYLARQATALDLCELLGSQSLDDSQQLEGENVIVLHSPLSLDQGEYGFYLDPIIPTVDGSHVTTLDTT